MTKTHMKTIGLIGGMGWESSTEYYQIINEGVNKKLGGIHSAKIILVSLDLGEISKLQEANDWDGVADILIDAAKTLENAGADMLLLCSNTVHKVADQVEDATALPLINIVGVTGQRISNRGIKKVGLLGTKFTMEDGFYQEGLRKHGIEAVVPDTEQRQRLHEIIFDPEFLTSKRDEAVKLVNTLVEDLASKGVEGIILGCTELRLVTSSDTSKLPLFDSAELHARAAIEEATFDD